MTELPVTNIFERRYEAKRRIQFESFLLYVLIFSIPFPVYINIGGSDVGTFTTLWAFITGFYCLFVSSKKSIIDKSSRTIVILSILSFIPLGFTLLNGYNDDLLHALRRLFVMVANLVIFWVVAKTIEDVEHLRKFAKLLLSVIVIESIAAVALMNYPSLENLLFLFRTRTTVETAFTNTGGLARAKGTIGDYELIAEMMSIGIAIAVGFITSTKAILQRLVLLFSLAVMGYTIVLTGTRGAVISLSFGLVAFLFGGLWTKAISRKSFFIFLLLLGSIILLLSNVEYYSPEISAYTNRMAESQFYGIVPDSRLEVWFTYIELVGKNLWLGYGFTGTLSRTGYIDAHSLWIQLLYIAGIPALVTFCSFLVVLLYKSAKVIVRINYNREQLLIITGIVSALVVFIVDQTKISYMRMENYQHFIWIFLSLAFSLQRVKIEK